MREKTRHRGAAHRRPGATLAALICIAMLLMVLAPSAAWAAPLTRDTIPEPLHPWTDWVLHGQEEARCPFFHDTSDRRACAWPSALALELADRGGRFVQQWAIYDESWVPLPGDLTTWPEDVRVDGEPVVIVEQRSAPSVQLEPGTHRVEGTLRWDALPSLLQVPAETGLLQLNVRGTRLAFPNRDAQGRLWLAKRDTEAQQESRLDVEVSRRVTDDVPLQLTTKVALKVSGKDREVLLGVALPSGFVPMSLTAPIPARVEPDRRLRVQVRPGTWQIEIVARHEGPVAQLSLPAADGPWDSDEVWAFEARPDLRLVGVEGVPAVDPQQTNLPNEWRALPAYLMRPGATMTLTEKRRGDTDSSADQLTLARTWWLDFDGAGYTVHDELTGTAHRSWRLEMAPPTILGRVAVSGTDQFITRIGDDQPVGIEIRQRDLRINADSRIDGDRADIPAVSWSHDFQAVSGVLNLPPGWRVMFATGVDDIEPTWVSSWTLLDLFLVLIIALAIARLWGRLVGVLALAALALTWTEPGAPQWAWLPLLVAEAFGRVLPDGTLRRLVNLGRAAAAAVLVVAALPFVVQQVRQAIYPQLEDTSLSLERRDVARAPAPESAGGAVAAKTAGLTAADEEAALSGAVHDQLGRTAMTNAPRGDVRMKHMRTSEEYAPDPKALVTTGPGLPRWVWHAVRLRWHGPVERTQRVHLLLVSPVVNVVIALVRAGLLLLLGIYGLRFLTWGRASAGPAAGATTAVILVAAVAALAAARAAQADMPSPELLRELQNRLLEQPKCRPECAASPRLTLEVGTTTLRARMEVDAAAVTAIPLPGAADQWLPERVLLDGEPARALQRSNDGTLWLALSPGKHQVLMEGGLPERDTVEIPLPLKPHWVETRTEGWKIGGLHDVGRPEDSLHLTRVRGSDDTSTRTLEPAALPPYVRVERALHLGLTWETDTVVTRLTPLGAPIVLEVPLLTGESVTTAGVRVVDEKAQITLGPQVARLEWHSVLAEADALALRAPDAVSWTEVWRLDASPIWHVVREWQPWPGETVRVAVTRPGGIPGPTLTLDRSVLTVSPGLRATDVTLDLEARSSRGGQHTFELPVDADLQAVAIDGRSQAIRQEGQTVTLPLVPGAQTMQLSWRQRSGIATRFVSPAVRMGVASVNAETRIVMPTDRWSLAFSGPRMGPAILFWSLLAVFAVFAVALGRTRWTPLRAGHWFLLGIGLTQVPIAWAAIVVGWLVAFGWRRQHVLEEEVAFNLVQLILALWTVIALGTLFLAIQQGLLGLPEMQIVGNGSNAHLLRWYQDRASEDLPRARVLSVPLFAYRLAMLAWALWLAQALLGWLRWSWTCFSTGGLWRGHRKAAPRPVPQGPRS